MRRRWSESQSLMFFRIAGSSKGSPALSCALSLSLTGNMKAKVRANWKKKEPKLAQRSGRVAAVEPDGVR